MTLKYVGKRAFKMRLGEFGYSEKEEGRAAKIFEYLKKQGWDIDTGVYEWAAVEVADRAEFDYLMADFKAAKRIIK